MVELHFRCTTFGIEFGGKFTPEKWS